MKSLHIIVAASAIALFSGPAAAQLGSNSDQFVEAVSKRDGDKAIQLLQDHPNVIDARTSQGDTALIISIARTDREFTGFLLNKGADPNVGGKGGDTPLIAAARVGFEEAANWLLGLGAKVDAANKMGETPLIVAVQQRNVPLVKLFLDHGADPDKTDAAAGYSAREYAARDNRSRQILQLIEQKKPKAK